MNIEVEIMYSEYDTDWEVAVFDLDADERVEELEKFCDTEQEASDYVDELVQNKKYVVTHV